MHERGYYVWKGAELIQKEKMCARTLENKSVLRAEV